MPDWVVIITSVDPADGVRDRAAFEVTPPPEPGTERSVLRELVRGIHPDAAEWQGDDGSRMRFQDGEREITAWFEIDGSPAPPPVPPEQGSLFDG